jgi:hypothetical protein
MSHFAANREYYAGALMAAIGAGAIYEGMQYGVGGLSNMGSGFFPVALGAGMVVLGGIMAVVRPAPPDSHSDSHTGAARPPDWRGAGAIFVAVVLFIALANTAGLAPATFACVFAGAMGTRATRWGEAALLAIGVTVFGVLLFSYGLQVQFPIIRGVMQ